MPCAHWHARHLQKNPARPPFCVTRHILPFLLLISNFISQFLHASLISYHLLTEIFFLSCGRQFSKACLRSLFRHRYTLHRNELYDSRHTSPTPTTATRCSSHWKPSIDRHLTNKNKGLDKLVLHLPPFNAESLCQYPATESTQLSPQLSTLPADLSDLAISLQWE